ncbi:S-layer homology domain-containing protein [Cohnella silvisoli]|uniref:S-layer homology domain-containing protein n=1 Tax=Cohnella silvisoli TaxID=2873699 RepID=A0ABV1KZE2_9BACL|nr:S-layer homology domain-containing protein [Cohnella silvisoli]MCD9024757.1 S-layer homology domain-containing protein [Cohnella silvisoli]
MKNKVFKKVVSFLVVACLLFSSFGVAFGASAAVTSDIKGHWAEAQISAWMDKGLIKGYEDGSFKPNNNITRAEFISMINRSFGFTEETAITFSDVQAGNWAYPEIAKAVKAGYITGYADGTIGASKPVSRQEVAAIVDRLLGLSKKENAATAAFTDSSSIAIWAKGSVDAVVAKGIMKGFSGGDSFKPGKSTTRAEAVVTLDRAINTQAVVYKKAGTYGPAAGVETINKNVVVLVAGVTLQNMVINGDLLLGEGIGNGDAFLNNVKVTGTVTVQGGGENSIHFNNSVLVDIIIDKKSGTGIVRIVSEGSTTVSLVVVNSPATIREMNTSGKGFANINLSPAIPAGSKVTLLGAFNTVNVSSQQIQVDVPEGSIETLNANASATGITVNLTEGAKINALILDAIVKVLGKGTIVTATVNIPGTTFQTPPQTTTTPTPKPVVTTPPSGGGAPTTPSAVIVSGITVTGAGNATTVVFGGTLQMNAAVAPANATNQTIAWAVASGTGAATINATGLLTATGVGNVTVTATNAASGVTGTRVITITADPLIAAYTNAANVAAIQTLLDANALGLTLTDYAGLDATGKTEVATALFGTKATLTTKALIQSAADAAIGLAKPASEVRKEEALVAQYTNAADVEEVEALLIANELALTLTDYEGLDARGKTEVAEALYGMQDDLTTKALIQEAVTSEISIAKVFSDWRKAQVAMYTNAADVGEVETLLGDNALGLTLTDYDGLDATGKTAVATALFNTKATLTTEELIHSAVTEAIIAAKLASDARKLATLVAQYTNAADAATVQALLGTNELGLTLTDYEGLDEAGKTEVAEVLYDLQNDLITKESIQTAVITASATAKPASDERIQAALVAQYTNAANASAVQSLLIENMLELTLTNYWGLDATGKTAVATALFNTKATLTTEELIQSAVAAAIASAKPASDARILEPSLVAQYRNAVSVAAIQALLDTNVLGLTVTFYLALDPTGKTEAATTLYSSRSTFVADGFFTTDKAALQNQLNMASGQASSASNARIANAVAAINSAADEAAMATAITNHAATLGLVLIDYNALANKVPVQIAMIAQAFANRATVVAAFNTAVANQKAVEAGQVI